MIGEWMGCRECRALSQPWQYHEYPFVGAHHIHPLNPFLSKYHQDMAEELARAQPGYSWGYSPVKPLHDSGSLARNHRGNGSVNRSQGRKYHITSTNGALQDARPSAEYWRCRGRELTNKSGSKGTCPFAKCCTQQKTMTLRPS